MYLYFVLGKEAVEEFFSSIFFLLPFLLVRKRGHCLLDENDLVLSLG
jgi:hypothetical protein